MIPLALVTAVLAFALALVVRGERRARRRAERLGAELESLQRAFSRFAPPQIVDDIAAGGSITTGEEREVTVLFADLQGFTRMSAGLAPPVVVEILNGYFAEMTRAIAAHHGQVSKFIGDGIMAVFGAVEPNPWQARDAAEAALAMRAALASYNERLRAAGRPELKFGVGLHRGVVVAGFLGCEQLTEFTVIGDVVNVASRVESLTRQHGVDILVTAEVREGLDGKFTLKELPAAEIKGKSEPLVTWSLV